jgi:hypothetical protein
MSDHDSLSPVTGLASSERELQQPPSRATNPFATCWTRPGALSFRFPAGESADTLIARLAANNWWGEIVGPHGSGKSTLLATLRPAIERAGRLAISIALRDGQRRLPRGSLNWDGASRAEPPSSPGSAGASPSRRRQPLVIIDGYEQLSWLARRFVKHRCRRRGAGLLVSSHTPTGLPTLITLAPDLPLIEQLVATLGERSATRVSPADVSASHAGRGSNVRDIFFDLYDRHEQLRGAR